MIIVNKTCPASASLNIGRIGNSRTDAAPGKSVQEEIMEAEQKAEALWNGAETCVCCGAAIPDGRQVCKKCEVMRHEQA